MFAQKLNLMQPVDRIIYCTAMVSSTPADPQKAQRQETYHRAIGIACPTVEIVKGQFTRHKTLHPIAGCTDSPTCGIRVVVKNEKGSDVNLASRLLHDAHMGRFDRAIVVSGDSDLTEPIRLIVSEVGKAVWVRNPRNVGSAELEKFASDYARIRPGVLQRCQLPDPVADGAKRYSKPAKWSTIAPARIKTNVLTTACPQAGCGKAINTFRYV